VRECDVTGEGSRLRVKLENKRRGERRTRGGKEPSTEKVSMANRVGKLGKEGNGEANEAKRRQGREEEGGPWRDALAGRFGKNDGTTASTSK